MPALVDRPILTLPEALAQLDTWAGQLASAHVRDILSNDDPAWATSFLDTRSGCAVVGKALAYAVGCRCREHAAYVNRIGMAVADVGTIARRHGAWYTSAIDLGAPPSPGDLQGVDIADPARTHICCVRGYRPADAAILYTDGGQGTHGARIEHRARYLIRPLKGPPFLEDTDDGISTRVGQQRPLYGLASLEAIASSLHLCR